MLERLLLPDKHAITILMKDHDTVKKLFDRFEKSESAAEKEKIILQALTELKVHAVIEEEIFYPAVRKHVGKDLMNEADEEHHVARVLIAELDRDGHADDHRDAKFTVLAESVRHHIKEEEGEMLPKAKSLEMDFETLGQQMLDRKKELKRDGIPADKEHAMVAAMNGKGDTPAAAARRRTSDSPAMNTRGMKLSSRARLKSGRKGLNRREAKS
jgi:hemerythrin-like domain-containing protein